MQLRRKLWNPYILVFVSSGSIMVIELVASRLIAPRIGVSLYTWTSIIGVVLAGISLGNYVGGRLADRFPTPGLLGIVFTGASLTTLLALWLNSDLHAFRLPWDVPMMVWIVMYIAAVFLVPSVILGCVAPIVVRLSLTDLEHSGTTVGKIYAWSSAGSIAGTFLAGFYLISRFGTKATFVGVSALLLLLGIWFLLDISWKRSAARAALVLAIFGGSLLALNTAGYLQLECMDETNYFCINVRETERDNRTVHVLLLDRLVHSYTDLDDPLYLVYGYEQTYAALMEPIIEAKPDLAAFFIGGGGYTFPRYVRELAPESHLVVSEIDPGVTEAAHRWLGLPRDTDIITHNVDARGHLMWSEAPDSYDVVFGDAFDDYSVPYHLTTLEFTQLVDSVLKDDGVYMANIIDAGTFGRFFRAFVATQQEVFEHVVVIPSIAGWQESTRSTFVVASSHHPIDTTRLLSPFRALSPDELAEYMSAEPYIVLTDDFVPVDNLMAPVVQASFAATALEPEVAARVRERMAVMGGVGLGVAALGAGGWRLLHRRSKQDELAS
jgi:spermidine synthase